MFSLKRAKRIIKYLPNHLITVGSVERGLAQVNDIDLMTTKDLDDVISDIRHMYKVKIMVHGKSYIHLLLKYHGKYYPVDIWRYDADNLLFAKFARIGSQQYIIRTREQAKRLGYTLDDTGLYKNGHKLQIQSKKRLLHLLHLHNRKWSEMI